LRRSRRLRVKQRQRCATTAVGAACGEQGETMRIAMAAALGLALISPAHAQVSDATRAANAEMSRTLPWGDREDEDFASRGFIAAWDQPQIRTADGRVVWDFTAYDFLRGPAPETVNPICGGTRGCLSAPDSSRCATASIRCAASTCRT
jgi:hypothetical protein